MDSIFRRVRLTPSQARTVADRRFADAEVLRNTRKNAHANGVFYLGGLVIECLLKAYLLEKYRWLQTHLAPLPSSPSQQDVWSLCYRSHDLDVILGHLPEIFGRLVVVDRRGSMRLVQMLKSICGQWTIFARYSPRTESMVGAERFLDNVKELKEWLKLPLPTS